MLAAYLIFVFVAGALVYLGDAHDLAIGQWADTHEYLLFVAVPLAVLLVVPGHLVSDGGSLAFILMVFGAAVVEVVVVHAIAALGRRVCIMPARGWVRGPARDR